MSLIKLGLGRKRRSALVPEEHQIEGTAGLSVKKTVPGRMCGPTSTAFLEELLKMNGLSFSLFAVLCKVTHVTKQGQAVLSTFQRFLILCL